MAELQGRTQHRLPRPLSLVEEAWAEPCETCTRGLALPLWDSEVTRAPWISDSSLAI